MDPLSIAAAVAGLISLARDLLRLLIRFVDDVRSYPKELNDLMAEIRGLCGALVLLQPVIEKIGARQPPGEGIQRNTVFT